MNKPSNKKILTPILCEVVKKLDKAIPTLPSNYAVPFQALRQRILDGEYDETHINPLADTRDVARAMMEGTILPKNLGKIDRVEVDQWT